MSFAEIVKNARKAIEDRIPVRIQAIYSENALVWSRAITSWIACEYVQTRSWVRQCTKAFRVRPQLCFRFSRFTIASNSQVALRRIIIPVALGLTTIHAGKLILTSVAPKPNAPPIPVEAVYIESKDLKETFRTFATLLPIRETYVRPGTAQMIREVPVMVGQYVKQNEAVLLTGSEAQRIKQELDRIEMESKEIDFRVTDALARKNYLSQKEVDQRALEKRSTQLRSRLAQLDSSGVLRTPIGGRIAEISVRRGDYVESPSQAYVRIIDDSGFRISTFAPQTLSRRLKMGQSVLLRRRSGLGASQTVEPTMEIGEGVVSAVSPVVDTKTGSLQVEIELTKAHPDWLAGIQVEVLITLDEKLETPSLPLAAIRFENGKGYVFRVKEIPEKDPGVVRKLASLSGAKVPTHDSVEKIQVKIGLTDEGFVEVQPIDADLSFEEGDQFVTTGIAFVTPGAKIDIRIPGEDDDTMSDE